MDTVEDSLTCVVCYELFDDPRLAPCSHTYCRKCIELLASVNADQFECPLRDGCKILTKDIHSLPLNRTVHGLVELYVSTQRSNQCTICHLVVAEHLCDGCQNQQFCLKCYQKKHAATTIMKKHRRLAFDPKSSSISSCLSHPHEQLKYCCRNCNDVPICRNCKSPEHKNHKYAVIEDVAKEFETKINMQLQSIQSSLDYRIDQANKFINAVDNESKSSRMEVKEAMTLLRRVIDEHEQSMLQQISTNEILQKNQLEDYKTPLKNELQNLNIQKITLEILVSSKSHAKLLQTKQKFDDYVNNTNGTMKLLRMPNRDEYFLQGLDQLQNLKEGISQCGRYVQVPPYHNPQLEQLMAKNRTAQTLDLSKRYLTDSDMKIMAFVLRKSATLTVLSLAKNQIGHQGAQYIADALKTNKTLTTLDLQQNQIGQQGAQHIADVLKINQTLTELDLQQNEIGQQGAQHIAAALKVNQTLTTLGLQQNQIGQQGAQYITNALKNNQTLTKLWLEENEIEQEVIQ